jgi:hypothetical protein
MRGLNQPARALGATGIQQLGAQYRIDLDANTIAVKRRGQLSDLTIENLSASVIVEWRKSDDFVNSINKDGAKQVAQLCFTTTARFIGTRTIGAEANSPTGAIKAAD